MTVLDRPISFSVFIHASAFDTTSTALSRVFGLPWKSASLSSKSIVKSSSNAKPSFGYALRTSFLIACPSSATLSHACLFLLISSALWRTHCFSEPKRCVQCLHNFLVIWLMTCWQRTRYLQSLALERDEQEVCLLCFSPSIHYCDPFEVCEVIFQARGTIELSSLHPRSNAGAMSPSCRTLSHMNNRCTAISGSPMFLGLRVVQRGSAALRAKGDRDRNSRYGLGMLADPLHSIFHCVFTSLSKLSS